MADRITRERQKIISLLTYARIEKGMSQQALADLVGSRRSNICRIESGNQNISLDMLLRLAEALGKDVSITLSDKRNENMENIPMKYYLKLYDDELLSFALHKEGLSGLKAEIVSVNDRYRPLFPLDLELTGSGIVRWLENRVIPKNRAYVGEILKQLNLSIDDTQGIIDVCKGLSLNDSYWVTSDEFTGKFADFNLYENRFSEILSLVAYTGNMGSHEVFTTSPELTTNGALPKAWRFMEGDGIYLYKCGTPGAVNSGKEPYSEYYSCQIAENMKLNVVHYDLESWKGLLASKCRLFTDIDTSFVPAGRIIKESSIPGCLRYCESLGRESLEQFKDMLVFDSVIYNEDRHYGNFGFLRDNHTGKILGPAPVFDNGFSLFCQAMPDSFKDLGTYAATLGNPYGISYSEICREIMGDRQRRNLRRMLDFSFTRHEKYNLPEERLRAIENQVQIRTRELLALPRIRPRPEREER